MAEKTLWECFNLGENNPDPGGGIMYCLLYDLDRIQAHRGPVVQAIQGMGVGLQDSGDNIAVVYHHKLGGSEQRRLNTLLEELSVLNEAQEYHEAGFGGCKTIEGLKNIFVSAYFARLEQNELPQAYDIVDLMIPEIVGDILRSNARSKFLYAHERKTLADLLAFARRQANLNNSLGGFMVIG